MDEITKDRFNQHEKRLDEHDKKIDVLEKDDATNTNEIKKLCTQIASLVGTL